MKGTIARFVIIVGAASSLAMPCGVAAQVSPFSDWKLHALLYGWFPTVSGESSYWTSGPAGAELKASDSLDASAFDLAASTLERPRSRWGLNADYFQLDTDAGNGATRGLSPTGPMARMALPADAYAAVHPRLHGWSWSLLGSYALVDQPSHQVQLLGGTRYLRVDTTVDPRLRGDLARLPTLAASGASTAKSDVWDAVVGAKGRYRFGEQGRWFLPYYFDVGAGQSDFTWQAMGGIGYRFGWGELFASYRHLDYRFDSGYRLKDLSFSGPGVGLSFRW